VIAGVLGAETPQHGAAITIKIHWLVTDGVVAAATGTNRLTAAIVIGHQVVAVIGGIATGTHPGNWGRFGARRTGSIRTTAART
jgi:hypothetical protein